MAVSPKIAGNKFTKLDALANLCKEQKIFIVNKYFILEIAKRFESDLTAFMTIEEADAIDQLYKFYLEKGML